MALGKALGAGVPIGAAMFTDRVAAAAKPGDHGSTYGGNLLACRAALVFLDELTGRRTARARRAHRRVPGARPPRDGGAPAGDQGRCAAPA